VTLLRKPQAPRQWHRLSAPPPWPTQTIPPGRGAAKRRAPLALKKQESYTQYTTTLHSLDTFIHTHNYGHITPRLLWADIIPDFIASQPESTTGQTAAQYLSRIAWFSKHDLLPAPPADLPVGTNNVTSLAAAGALPSLLCGVSPQAQLSSQHLAC
jgi:hypothetical protein